MGVNSKCAYYQIMLLVPRLFAFTESTEVESAVQTLIHRWGKLEEKYTRAAFVLSLQWRGDQIDLIYVRCLRS